MIIIMTCKTIGGILINNLDLRELSDVECSFSETLGSLYMFNWGEMEKRGGFMSVVTVEKALFRYLQQFHGVPRA